MKTAKRTLIAFFVFISFTNFTNGSYVLKEDAYIEVYFSNKLEFNDLVKIKLDLSEKAIILNYKQLEFNEDGKLSSIQYKFTADKVGGSDGSNNTAEEIGFIINTSTKPKYGIIVGTKKQIQQKRLMLEKSNLQAIQ